MHIVLCQGYTETKMKHKQEIKEIKMISSHRAKKKMRWARELTVCVGCDYTVTVLFFFPISHSCMKYTYLDKGAI